MSVKLISTKAKVKEAEKLKEVLDKYALGGIDFPIDGEGNLQVVGKPNADWPEAIAYDQLPSEEQFPDEDARIKEVVRLFEGKGDEGLLSLLGEIAACLETPLLILAVERDDDGYCIGRVWSLQPGGKVETLRDLTH